MIAIGEEDLLRAVDEYITHYHGYRNRQGLGNELIRGPAQTPERGDVVCEE